MPSDNDDLTGLIQAFLAQNSVECDTTASFLEQLRSSMDNMTHLERLLERMVPTRQLLSNKDLLLNTLLVQIALRLYLWKSHGQAFAVAYAQREKKRKKKKRQPCSVFADVTRLLSLVAVKLPQSFPDFLQVLLVGLPAANMRQPLYAYFELSDPFEAAASQQQQRLSPRRPKRKRTTQAPVAEEEATEVVNLVRSPLVPRGRGDLMVATRRNSLLAGRTVLRGSAALMNRHSMFQQQVTLKKQSLKKKKSNPCKVVPKAIPTPARNNTVPPSANPHAVVAQAMQALRRCR